MTAILISVLKKSTEAIDACVRDASCRTTDTNILRMCLEELVIAAKNILDRGKIAPLRRLINLRWKVEGLEEKEGNFARRLVTARLMAKRADTVEKRLVKEDEGSVTDSEM